MERQRYPIAYGKYYCFAFNKNDKLSRNPQTSEWVRKTNYCPPGATAGFRGHALANAARMDAQRFQQDIALNRWLTERDDASIAANSTTLVH